MATLKIGFSATLTILHDHLGVNKKFACWVPHRLTPDQKQARVEWSQKMLERFDGGSSKLVVDIVTGDESWIYQCYPETNASLLSGSSLMRMPLSRSMLKEVPLSK